MESEIDFWSAVYKSALERAMKETPTTEAMKHAALVADEAVMARRQRVRVPNDQRITTAAEAAKKRDREAERDRNGEF